MNIFEAFRYKLHNLKSPDIMTKLSRLDIVLSNPQVVYFPGQCIQGQLIVELTGDMKMRGIRIKCRGKGHVYWSNGSGDNRRTYNASEEYMDVVLVVFGNDCSSDVTLHAGNHMFPFQFILPMNIPGSFEGKSNCYVRYWMKGTIDRPWKFDPEIKMLFTIGSVLDLNTLPNAPVPAQLSDSKTVCCCCCESLPISASFRIDKTGYVPGETITFNAEIQEGTGRGVHSSKVKLIMVLTYRTHANSRLNKTTEIARLEHGSISPGSSDVWNGERIQIPPLPPSYLPNCTIIEINYYVELTVDVADTPFDLTCRLDVIIGTIPLQSAVNQYMPHIEPGIITNQPIGFAAPVNFDLPPPTYQECVLGKVDTADDDDKHASGDMNFAPSYTYYDWMNHPTPSAPS